MKIIFLNAWNGAVGKSLWDFFEKEKESTDIFVLMETNLDFQKKADVLLTGFTSIKANKEVNNEDEYFQTTYVKNNSEIESFETILDGNRDIGYGIYTKIKSDKSILNLINVHGIALPGDKLDNPKRIEQSMTFINFMKKVKGPKIVGGDFNLLPETESVKMFEKNGYTNLVKEYDIKTTRNHLSWDLYPNKQMYADYVFVSKDIKVKSFEVPDIEISDHLPLILEIE